MSGGPLPAWLSNHLADLFALAGFACLVRGLFLLAPWAGWLTGGVVLLVLAAVAGAMERFR